MVCIYDNYFLFLCLAKNNIFLGIIIISLLCFFYKKFLFYYYYPKKKYAVDTILCFVIGFYYSIIKIHLDKIMMKNDIFYFLILSITILIFYESSKINNLFFISLSNAIFSLLIFFISMKIKLKNDFLKFLNTHSYSIYL